MLCRNEAGAHKQRSRNQPPTSKEELEAALRTGHKWVKSIVTASICMYKHRPAAWFTTFCPHEANVLQWKTRGVFRRRFQKGVRVQQPFIGTETPTAAHDDNTWKLTRHGIWPRPLNLNSGAEAIVWTFWASRTSTDALDWCSVNGRSRYVKLSHRLRPSCGFHLSSKLCWSTLAEEHPSGMYQMLTTAVFVLCKEGRSRTVESA